MVVKLYSTLVDEISAQGSGSSCSMGRDLPLLLSLAVGDRPWYYLATVSNFDRNWQCHISIPTFISPLYLFLSTSKRVISRAHMARSVGTVVSQPPAGIYSSRPLPVSLLLLSPGLDHLSLKVLQYRAQVLEIGLSQRIIRTLSECVLAVVNFSRAINLADVFLNECRWRF